MKKKTILILSLAFIAVILGAVGTSFALYRINVTSGNTFKFVTGTLTLEISDTEPNGTIIVNNLVPMSDAAGMNQTGYSFTLTNAGSIDAGYTMYLDDVIPSGETKTRVSNSLIRVNLTNTTTNTSSTYTLSNLTNRAIEIGTLPASSNNTNNYVLRIWLDQSATNTEQNKYFAAKIRIEGVQANTVPTASFATDPWTTIVANIRSGHGDLYAPTNAGVDNQVLREVDLGSLGTHYLRVANTTPCTNGETSETACGFVVEFADVITTRGMNGSSTNAGGYPASSMFTYINNTLLPAMPQEIRDIMIPTTVVSSHGSTSGETNFTTSNQYLYLLDAQEVFGNNDALDTAAGTTKQLDYYRLNNTAENRIKKSSGTASVWWLRPAASNSTINFFSVNGSGGTGITDAVAWRGVSPAFRIG